MNADHALIAEIGEANFEPEVMESKRPVLVAFLARWSRPCHIIRPVLDEVAEACAGSVKIVTINADDNPDLGMCYGIQSIPTLLCFVDGGERARIVGTASQEAVLSKLKPFLGAL
ncbi:MAG: thioredoxin family protein [Limisphaerales bacterium]